MHRRQFVTACSVGACALGLGLPGCRQNAGPLQPQLFARVRLVDPDGEPLRADALEVEHGGTQGARAEARGDVVAQRLQEYSSQVLRC